MRLRLFASLRDKVTSSGQSPVPLLVGPSQGSSLSIVTEPHVGLHVLPERENGRQSMFDRAFGDLFAPCDDPPSATCSCRRGIETKFDVVSDASIQRAINLGQRAAQLARQRSKALAAGTVVAGFAGALEQCSCSGDPRGADRLGGSLEFVSRGCEGRKIARAGAGFDHALALDRGVAKLPQKGIDGALVTEPIGQNSAVDGSDRVRLGVASFWLAFAAVDG